MVLFKTVIFFMYFKMQELCGVTPKIGKYIWKLLYRDIMVPFVCITMTVFVAGAVIFSVWYFISPGTVDRFVWHTLRTCLEGHGGYVAASYMCCLLFGAVSFVALLIGVTGYYIWTENVWGFLQDNWRKATLRATKGVTYDIS